MQVDLNLSTTDTDSCVQMMNLPYLPPWEWLFWFIVVGFNISNHDLFRWSWDVNWAEALSAKYSYSRCRPTAFGLPLELFSDSTSVCGKTFNGDVFNLTLDWRDRDRVMNDPCIQFLIEIGIAQNSINDSNIWIRKSSFDQLCNLDCVFNSRSFRTYATSANYNLELGIRPSQRTYIVLNNSINFQTYFGKWRRKFKESRGSHP